ncbi:tyrosine-type recombinase/integrase [Bradyrhizobium sp. USDA 313]|uniref:tyrosine-type recombinase/integrase n=1 Tax=Bradyrhizobium sp. USDA 313 TaxID=3156307 RepID=UPI003514A93D
MGNLTKNDVKNAKPGDRLSDGDGLRLDVDKNGNASWIFRFKSPKTSKERFMGLGPSRDVDLPRAREAASAARALLRKGIDPKEHRDEERAKAKAEAKGTITFEAYAKQYIAGKEAGWKNQKHRQQWTNSLRDYAFPIIGKLAIPDIDVEAVRKVLDPIWDQKKETARRVRGRIEAILNGAKADKLRTGDNPALWRGHLDQVLAKRRKSDVQHHPALPYEEMPEFWRSLADDTSDAAQMLRFVILTACRFNEAAAMDPAREVKGETWTIPAARMKAEREHRVPLTAAALAQLPFRAVSDVTLSSCIARHTSTAATTHGMRSTFRDWAGDRTSFPREIAEMALAHAVGDETEAAYRRSTALAKRRELMEAWAAFCASSLDSQRFSNGNCQHNFELT